MTGSQKKNFVLKNLKAKQFYVCVKTMQKILQRGLFCPGEVSAADFCGPNVSAVSKAEIVIAEYSKLQSIFQPEYDCQRSSA